MAHLLSWPEMDQRCGLRFRKKSAFYRQYRLRIGNGKGHKLNASREKVTMVSLMDVQARWGYSEILDGTAAHFYDNGPDTLTLREARKASVPFDNLTKEQRYSLAFQCASIRTNLFFFFTGTEQFDLALLNRAELGNLLVPPNVSGESSGRLVRFSDYINAQTSEPRDARMVHVPKDGYKSPNDPLTLGHIYGNLVLLDGYHRAALFWKYAPDGRSIQSYKPRL